MNVQTKLFFITHFTDIWETLLEGRIKLQPSLIAANKLYQKEDFINFKSLLQPEDETVLSNTYSSLGNLMKILLELQVSVTLFYVIDSIAIFKMLIFFFFFTF